MGEVTHHLPSDSWVRVKKPIHHDHAPTPDRIRSSAIEHRGTSSSCNIYLLVYDTPLTIEEVLTRLAERPKEIAPLTKDTCGASTWIRIPI
jgi:hypothetical protein